MHIFAWMVGRLEKTIAFLLNPTGALSYRKRNGEWPDRYVPAGFTGRQRSLYIDKRHDYGHTWESGDRDSAISLDEVMDKAQRDL